MKKRYEKALTLEDLAKRPDQVIDYSDIPELGEDFWANAVVSAPRTKPNVSLRLDGDVLEYFKAESPRGFTSKMALVLSAYVRAKKSSGGSA